MNNSSITKSNLPQATIIKMFEMINKHSHLIISGHINPDGDSLGAMWALYYSLSEYFPKKTIYLPFGKKAPFDYLVTKDYQEQAIDHLENLKNPLIILVDISTLARVPFRLDLNLPILRIDHHSTNDNFETIGWIDSKQPSTCEMIFHFLNYHHLPINRSVAEALLTGMITDTGNFSFSNTTGTSFAIASQLMTYQPRLSLIHRHLNAKTELDLKLLTFLTTNYVIFDRFVYVWLTPEDCRQFPQLTDTQQVKKFVNLFKDFANYQIWAIIIQLDAKSQIEVSVRSSGLNLISVVKKFNGGGHPQACGVKLIDPKTTHELLHQLAKLSHESH